MTQVIFVSGKGGSGTSAISAAAGLAAEVSTLAVDLRSSDGLGLHLGTDLAEEPRPISELVHTITLNPATVLVNYLRRNLPGVAGPAAPLLRAASESVPGIRETMVMGQIAELARTGAWDRILVDAPPSGQFEAYAGAIRTVQQLIPAGPIRKQADRVSETLSGATVWLVVLAEELAAAEALTSKQTYQEAGMQISRVILNRRVYPVVAPNATLQQSEAVRFNNEVSQRQDRWEAALKPDLVLPLVFGAETPLQVAERLSEEGYPWH